MPGVKSMCGSHSYFVRSPSRQLIGGADIYAFGRSGEDLSISTKYVQMFRRVRKSRIEQEELIADAVFLLVAFLISVGALYVFDIHWNFYPGGGLFPPERHVFQDTGIYLWGGLLGGVIGFFLIKLFLFGIREEEVVWKKRRRK